MILIVKFLGKIQK